MRLSKDTWRVNSRWRIRFLGVLAFAGMIADLPATPQAIQTAVPAGSMTFAMDRSAEAELQAGIALNRQAKFSEAIVHLQKAQGRVLESYAAEFNLALAYLGTANYPGSIRVLLALREHGGDTQAVNNLLAQAYIGQGQVDAAYSAFEEASRQSPHDEKLYAYIADACTDHHEYALGLRVVEVGLLVLPDSARLHYERGLFLATLDRLDEGRPEFDKASALAPHSDIAYLAEVQEALYDDDLTKASRIAREAVRTGHRDYQMQGLLGSVLLRNGAAPGQVGFEEAKTALETSVAANPDFSMAQIALGKAYLMERRFQDAVDHLEIAERLEPLNPAVYPNLASAYRAAGNAAKARECTLRLEKLFQDQANRKQSTAAP